MSKEKINILQFICPTGFYGAERWILALARHLDKDQFNCDLAVTLEDNSKDLELVRQYRKSGFGNTYEIPMQHRFDLAVINKLVKLIHERNIHVIHTHGYKSDILGVMAAKKAGIKCVVTPHGFENAKDLKLRLFIWLGCKAMGRADVVAPLSPQLVEDSKRFGVRKEKIHYIQNGVDLTEVEEQRAKPKKHYSDKKRIGFIGQMISRKNIFDIIRIFSSLADKHEDIELILVGDGEQHDELLEFSKEQSHNDRMHFLGFRDDRLELLQSFDLFVMTSTLEGIPRCLMEAFAMGIPVAAYDIAGIDQLVKHEQTGYLASPGDRDTLEKHWETLLYNDDIAKTIADNATDYVNQHYSGKRMASEYAELFKALLSR